jgi:hypothetical protein
LTPLLGEGFNNWVPLLVLVVSFITLFNLFGRIQKLFRMKKYLADEIDKNDETIEEGRKIISQGEIKKIMLNYGTYKNE